MKILITGSTGFIGKRLTQALLDEGHELFLLIRRGSLLKARNFFEENSRLHFVVGDLTNNDVIDHVSSAEVLNSGIESVLHLAASYDLGVGLTDAYLTNVVGTQNLLYLVQKLKGLKYFHYVSTYAVSGNYDGTFMEDDIGGNALFTDHYSSTKMQAELLVRNTNFKNVKLRIYRPGIVVGDSKTGEMDKIDGPYYFFRFFRELKKWTDRVPVPILPISYNSGATLPFIPVDTIVDWFKEMISHPTKDTIRTYHLLPQEKISIYTFLSESFRVYEINMRVQRVPYPALYSRLLPLFKIPAQVGPYMESKTRYSMKNLKADYPKLKSPKLHEYLKKLIDADNLKNL
jgi:nucleoside-diphosphate-sugar epimerase